MRAERILLSPPDTGEREEQAVVAALRSGWVAPMGPDVDAFEREVAERVGVEHAVALSSGTAALHLGLLALGAGPGTVVVTSTMTFAATAFAIAYTGAEPFFVDVDARAGLIDPALLDDALSRLEAAGERVSAIIPVDLFGVCADYTAIAPIAEAHDVPVFADAAESLGSHVGGRAAGAFGAAAALSFNGNKVMTTSGGGMLTTQDAEIARRVRHLATQAREPVRQYEHREIGFNYRLSNLLAALGRAQLSRLDEMIARRRRVRSAYRELIERIDGLELLNADENVDNCWLTCALVDRQRTGWGANRLMDALAREGIETRPLWQPMHRQPVFREARSVLTGTADRLYESGIALPSGSALSDEDVTAVIAAISRFAGVRHE